jgi:hypothetical protein
VRQGPGRQRAEPLVEALQHWLFEPGKIDGKPVALKFCWVFAWQLLIKASTKACKICFQHAANKASASRLSIFLDTSSAVRDVGLFCAISTSEV